MQRNSPTRRKRNLAPSSRVCEIQTASGPVLLPYEFRRSARTKYLRLSVTDSSQIVLRVPSSTSERSAVEFLRSQSDWLIESLDRVPQKIPLDQHLRQSPWLSVHGKKSSVSLETINGPTHWIADLNQGRVIIRYNPSPDPDDELLPALMGVGREVLPVHVARLASKVGVDLPTVCVRDQRTLWGSCTSAKSLSLNWRLLLLPPSLQDYIIFHELAHLTHMDHSPRFYTLLQSYDPHCAEHDHLVSKLSPELMLLGRRISS